MFEGQKGREDQYFIRMTFGRSSSIKVVKKARVQGIAATIVLMEKRSNLIPNQLLHSKKHPKLVVRFFTTFLKQIVNFMSNNNK